MFYASVAYLKDKIYLFSTLDDPIMNDNMSKTEKPIVAPNPKPVPRKTRKESLQSIDEPMLAEGHSEDEEEGEPDLVGEDSSDDDEEDEEEELEAFFNERSSPNEWLYPGVPIVHPRRSYSGHRSRDTIKDGKDLVQSFNSRLTSANSQFLGSIRRVRGVRF
jgi:hypothetical protein